MAWIYLESLRQETQEEGSGSAVDDISRRLRIRATGQADDVEGGGDRARR